MDFLLNSYGVNLLNINSQISKCYVHENAHLRIQMRRYHFESYWKWIVFRFFGQRKIIRIFSFSSWYDLALYTFVFFFSFLGLLHNRMYFNESLSSKNLLLNVFSYSENSLEDVSQLTVLLPRSPSLNSKVYLEKVLDNQIIRKFFI